MQVFTVVAVLAFIAVSAVQAFSLQELAQQEWEAFKTTYGKKYNNRLEESFRKKIYLENRRRIAVHNKAGEHSYTLGMNAYGDLLPYEFFRVRNGFKMPENKALIPEAVATFLPPANLQAVPESVDWREKGYVTPVKNQGDCGSCWAFSTTGALEGQVFRKTGKLVSLSEQNLVDCDREHDMGCGGGLPTFAFTYIKKNNGIDTEESYPYKGDEEKCHYNPKTKGGTDNGYIQVKSGDEEMLKIAVATIGPISVGIDASEDGFLSYSHGIYYSKDCNSTALDHGVLVVGYGTESGQDYWLVKNSWGGTWGEKGYIRMARNKKNNCGIATMATYPVV